jgi:hypothetical protein
MPKMLCGLAITVLCAPATAFAQDTDSIARALSNPAAANSSFTSNFDFTTYNPDAPDDNKWSIPIAAGISRTTIVGATPLKMSLQVWKYVEKPDAFGADWLVRLSIAPVIGLPWG